MCLIAGLGALGLGGGAAAGATAAATAGGLAQALQVAGLVASVAGPVIAGQQTKQAAGMQAKAYEQQAEQTSRLRAIEEQRTRRQFGGQIRRQAAQMAARGVSLDSPTALYLGQTAAEEMAFAAQTVRQTGMAEASELSTSAQLARFRGQQAAMTGNFTAAGNLLSGAPEVWPELLK